MSLSKAAEDIRNRAEDFTMFELGEMHLVPKEGGQDDEFILIGVDESNEEAVEIFEEWKSDWEDEIVEVGEDEMDEIPNVTVYEFEAR